MPRTAKSETDAGVTMVTRVEAWGVQRTKDEILAKLMPVKRRRGTAAVIDSTLTSDGTFQTTVVHSSRRRQAGHDAYKAVRAACGVGPGQATYQVLAIVHSDAHRDGQGNGHPGVSRSKRHGQVRRI